MLACDDLLSWPSAMAHHPLQCRFLVRPQLLTHCSPSPCGRRDFSVLVHVGDTGRTRKTEEGDAIRQHSVYCAVLRGVLLLLSLSVAQEAEEAGEDEDADIDVLPTEEETPDRRAVFTIPPGDVAALIRAIHTANGNGEADTIPVAAGTDTLTTGDNRDPGNPDERFSDLLRQCPLPRPRIMVQLWGGVTTRHLGGRAGWKKFPRPDLARAGTGHLPASSPHSASQRNSRTERGAS